MYFYNISLIIILFIILFLAYIGYIYIYIYYIWTYPSTFYGICAPHKLSNSDITWLVNNRYISLDYNIIFY